MSRDGWKPTFLEAMLITGFGTICLVLLTGVLTAFDRYDDRFDRYDDKLDTAIERIHRLEAWRKSVEVLEREGHRP